MNVYNISKLKRKKKLFIWRKNASSPEAGILTSARYPLYTMSEKGIELTNVE